jgi:hypothetical protein
MTIASNRSSFIDALSRRSGSRLRPDPTSEAVDAFGKLRGGFYRLANDGAFGRIDRLRPGARSSGRRKEVGRIIPISKLQSGYRLRFGRDGQALNGCRWTTKERSFL